LVSDVTVAAVAPVKVACTEGSWGLAMMESMMGLPPVLAGATHVRDTDSLPATATTLVGPVGTLNVVTGLLKEAGPVPFEL
jgi:hypothetical protein